MHIYSKIGLLLTRLTLLDEVLADDGLCSNVQKLKTGGVLFEVFNDHGERIFDRFIARSVIEAADTGDVANDVADGLFSVLAAWDENKEGGHHGGC